MHRSLTRSLTLLAASALSACTAGTAAAGGLSFYPLEELRALDPAVDRAELLAHARDVAPSKRGDEWRGLVERAAGATLAAAEVTDPASAEQALAEAEAQQTRFPFLGRSATWLGHRADLGVRALPHLQHRERGVWQRRILTFAQADSVTKGLAQRLAEEVLLKQLIPSTAAPLYELAFEREGASVCAAPTVAKIALEWASEGSAWAPATEKCWSQLAGPMVDAVKKAETRTEKLKRCKAMEAHGAEAAVKAACTLE